MDIIGPLMLGTLGFVVAFAYINMRQTEEQLAETRRRRAEKQAAERSAAQPVAAE
ncbi:hypothetical protein [Rhodovulum adriaticum]|uniref:Uncharacterized protein n=1 Tax=Rhodovulum adriaticum TaxID=35804 RepID=A0A4R2NVS3_RHOAD|nr:hypothetical protein [Rhodovulum adriaticum]TCP26120.1 hypothetical protein EV656_10282 [Rhodovulum adriaticum]